MEITFRFFASLSERTGATEGKVDLPGDATVRDLWDELGSRFPTLAEIGFTPMVACDMEYADWESPLRGVREVAFLPPVSGG